MITPERFQLILESLAVPENIKNYVVAFSGGVDSHVLLHLCSQLNFSVRAIHVHHGLQDIADEWVEHCKTVCASLQVSLQVNYVDAKPSRRESPEEAARIARYCALFANVGVDEVLLTAHHKNDQSETLLLQLLRGAGPAGLASMPAVRKINNIPHIRPMLAFSRDEIISYAENNHLKWVEDLSNKETNIDRNFIRNKIFPMIQKRWPQVNESLNQVAQLQQESLEIIEAMAAVDLASVIISNDTISLTALRLLSQARLYNVLRFWISHYAQDKPTKNILQQLVNTVINAVDDAEPLVRWSNTEVRRFKERLYLLPILTAHDEAMQLTWDLNEELVLHNLGIKLNVNRSEGRGLSVSLLEKPLTVRFRQSGEKFRPAGRKHRHTLKKLMQEAGIPPWMRARIPLLYHGDELVCVCGYWNSEKFFTSRHDEPSWRPEIQIL